MKTDLKFGDKLHINGSMLLVVRQIGGDEVKVLNRNGDLIVVALTEFDEFYVSPEAKFQQQVLKGWRSQGLNFAYDTLDGDLITNVKAVANFMYHYKDLRGDE